MPGPADPIVNVRSTSTSESHSVPLSEARRIIASAPASWRIETPNESAVTDANARIASDYSGTLDQADAFANSAFDSAFIGAPSALARALGSDQLLEQDRIKRQVNPGSATLGAIGGAVAPLLVGDAGGLIPAGASARAGAAITRAGEGYGVLGKTLAGATGAALDAGVQTAGQALADDALADDPITLEHISGSLGHAFMGGAKFGGVVGGTLSLAEHGLTRAKAGLDKLKAAQAAEATGAIPADVAGLDMKAAREAEKVEQARIVAEDVTPQRQALVQDLKGFREWHAEARPWDALATGNKDALDESIAVAKKAEAAAKKAEKNALKLRSAKAPATAGTAADGLPTWSEFVKGRMGPAMKETGSHGAAMTKLSEDFKALKARGVAPAGEAVVSTALADAEKAAIEARDLADAALSEQRRQAALVRERAPAWVREGGKQYIKADSQIRGGLDNLEKLGEATPAGNAARQSMRDALQKQRQIMGDMIAKRSELDLMHLTDTTTARATALSKVPEALERNKALQARLDALDAPQMSPRLEALQNHMKDLAAPKAGPTIAAKVRAAGAYAAVTAAGHAVLPGFAGFAIAPLGALAAAKALGEKAGPALASAVRASTARTARAVDAFLAVTKGAKRVAPKLAGILASKVLASAKFAPGPDLPADASIADHYGRVSREIASQVVPTPAGLKVRPGARRAMAAQLQPLAAHAPVLADRLETRAVARLEFMAAKMPKSTQIGTLTIPPTDIEIRKFARYVAAADDPGGIEERLAEGNASPEDAEVMRTLYPARFAHIVGQAMAQADQLPYQRRLSLSYFTGAPVDAAMDPRVLAGIQATYAAEPGSAGGTMAPRPAPTTGSIKKPDYTPAQRHAGG